MSFKDLMFDHIKRYNNYDVYQELYNTIVEFCELSHLEKPSEEIILSIYGAIVINKELKDEN